MATPRELLEQAMALPESEAEPQANARELFAQAQQLPEARPSSLGQTTGFGVRGAVQGPVTGITGLADLAANVVGSGANRLLEAAGVDYRVPRSTLTETVSGGLTDVEQALAETMGVTPMPDQPVTPAERMAFSTAEAGTAGAVPLVGLLGRGRALAQGAPAATSIAGQNIDELARITAARPAATTGSEVAAGAAANVGGAYGGDIAAEQFGEEARPYGQMVGGAVGALAPGVAGVTLDRAANLSLGTPESGQVFRAAQNAGVRPSIGIVGNRGAQYIENTTGFVPLVGSPQVTRLQTGQSAQAAQRLSDIADDIRPRGATGTTDPGLAGSEISMFAGQQAEALRRQIGQVEDQLTAAIGARTPVPTYQTLSSIRDLRRATGNAYGPQLDAETRVLMADRVPLNANVEQRARAVRSAAQRQIEQLTPQASPPGNPQAIQQARAQISQLRNTIEQANEALLRNSAVPYEVARAWRTGVGRRAENLPSIPGNLASNIYRGFTRDLEGVARQAGVDDIFEQAMRHTRQLHDMSDANLARSGDIPVLERVSQMEPQQAFNWVFEGGAKNWNRLQTLRQNMEPEQWRRMTGNIIERLGVSTPGQPQLGGEFSPDIFLTRWNQMSAPSKQILLGDFPEQAAQLDELAQIALAMKQRGKASNPAGTAATALTATGGAGLGAGLVTNPVATVGLTAATGVAINRILSEQLARAVANVNPSLAQRIMLRTPGIAGRAGQETAAAQQPEE